MLEKIYSTIQPDKLLHLIYRLDNADNGRYDLAPDNQFLQSAVLKVDTGKTYKHHKHNWKTPSYSSTIAQESWVVIKGSVEVIYYDVNDSIIHTTVIYKGDCSMTFEGGHGYRILEDNSVIYEFKTGPYCGQQIDKTFIGKS